MDFIDQIKAATEATCAWCLSLLWTWMPISTCWTCVDLLDTIWLHLSPPYAENSGVLCLCRGIHLSVCLENWQIKRRKKILNLMDGGAWWAAVHGVAKSRARLSNFTFPFHFHALEKEMATHSSVLAWRIPGTEEPGGLPSMGSHRAGHNWHDLAAAAAPHIWIQTLLHPLLSYKSSHFTNFFFLLLPPLGSNHTSYVGHLLKKAKIRHQEVYQLAQDKAHYFKSLL